jgi:hypothetical protein
VSGVISVCCQWIETYRLTFTLTAIDLEQGTFTKFKLSDDSAGRLDIGDFTARGLVVRYSSFLALVKGYLDNLQS